MSTQSTHAYIYAERRDEMLDYLLFFLNIFFLPKKKGTKCELNTEDSHFSSVKMISVHGPSIKDTKLLFKVIKVIIIICMCLYVFVHSNVQRLLVCICMCVYVCVHCLYVYKCVFVHVCVCALLPSMYIYEYV